MIYGVTRPSGRVWIETPMLAERLSSTPTSVTRPSGRVWIETWNLTKENRQTVSPGLRAGCGLKPIIAGTLRPEDLCHPAFGPGVD